MSAPPRARIPSTRAETPRLGTDTRTGLPGRAGAVLRTSGGNVVFGAVPFGVVAFGVVGFGVLGFGDGFVGTADVVPVGAASVLLSVLSCR